MYPQRGGRRGRVNIQLFTAISVFSYTYIHVPPTCNEMYQWTIHTFISTTIASHNFPGKKNKLIYISYNLCKAFLSYKVLRFRLTILINVREYRMGNPKKTFQRNWQHWVHKMKKNRETGSIGYTR